MDYINYSYFATKKTSLLKIYEKDSAGVWVYIRRLDDSSFGWPKNIEEAMQVDKGQLTWLLQGLNLIKGPKHPKYRDRY